MNKHTRYLSYVIRHKWWVLVAGLRTGAPLWRLVIHDWTKFLPSEWGPYAQFFYGDGSGEWLAAMQAGYNPPETAPWGFFGEDRFKIAWNYHQKRNKHHWQYWLLKNDDGEQFSVGMPDHFTREMVADWAGAGRAITGKWCVTDWYTKNSSRIILRSETRRHVEELLATHFGYKVVADTIEGAIT